MARKTYTTEERQAYNRKLRTMWTEAKQLAETDEVKAVFSQISKMGIAGISLGNVCLVMSQAQELGLNGLPYLDFKTYKHWKDAGFQVQKGEKHKVVTITWITPKSKNEAEEATTFRYPKATNLFHRSQVQPIGK